MPTHRPAARALREDVRDALHRVRRGEPPRAGTVVSRGSWAGAPGPPDARIVRSRLARSTGREEDAASQCRYLEREPAPGGVLRDAVARGLLEG